MSELKEEAEELMKVYLEDQFHESLLQLFSSPEFLGREEPSLTQVPASAIHFCLRMLTYMTGNHPFLLEPFFVQLAA